jgi:threonine-phosphate decarboxylase
MNFYEHGGNVYSAAKRLNVAINKIIDLSSNVLPFNILDDLLSKKMIDKKEIFNILTKLPSPYSIELTLKLAETFNLPEQNILIGSGTTEFIQIICSLYRKKKALIFIPTYSDYEKFLHLNNVKIEYILALENNNYEHNLVTSTPINADISFICNPNNPTGFIFNSKDLLHMIRNHENTLFILDESYMHFVKHFSKYSLNGTSLENVLVLNSFSKIYGLPGLRIGWAYSKNKTLLDKIKSHQSAWAVNSLAQYLVTRLLDYSMDFYFEKLENNKKYLYHNLLTFKNVKIYKSSANFYMFKYLRNNPEKMYNYFYSNRILLRNLENIRGLNNRYFRISVSTKENIDCFLNTLKEFIQHEL